MDWTAIALFIVIVGVLILVHEAGHFFAARRCGVRVKEFCIGFPPRILSVKRETRYSLGLIPIGGYVNMEQDDFFNSKPRTKCFILFAGPLAGLLFPILLLPVAFMFVHPPLEAAVAGLKAYVSAFVILIVAILGIATGEVPLEVVGPVGIAQVVGEIAPMGITILLGFAAILSIIISIINLLPIPALDGGRLVFALLEWFRGKRISPKVEGYIHAFGFGLLIALLVVITYHDVLRLLEGVPIIPPGE